MGKILQEGCGWNFEDHKRISQCATPTLTFKFLKTKICIKDIVEPQGYQLFSKLKDFSELSWFNAHEIHKEYISLHCGSFCCRKAAIKLELIASWADPLLSQISNGIPNLKLQERIYGLFHKNISNILFQIPIIKKRRGEWWFFRTNQFTNIGLVR